MTLDDETAERDVFAHKTDEFVAQWLENDLPKLKRPGFGNTHDMVQSAIRRLRAGYAARDAEVEELRDELEATRDHAKAAVHRAEGGEAAFDTVNEALAATVARVTVDRDAALATLAKVREWAERTRGWYGDDVLAILDESPTERESRADDTVRVVGRPKPPLWMGERAP